MTLLGINSDAHGTYPAQLLRELGAGWVRVVAYPDVDLKSWLEACRLLGIKVLMALCKESFSFKGPYSDDVLRYKGRYGDLIDAWQVGNEADHDSISSWTLSPRELSVLLRACRMGLGEAAYLVGPGLVSGQPDYLMKVDLKPLDAIAVHPYGRRPDDGAYWAELPGNFGTIAELVDRYRTYNKPIWLTEFGVSTDQVSEAFHWRYVKETLEWITRQNNLGPTFLFTLHPYAGFGLLRSDGTRKAAFSAFQRSAGAWSQPETPKEQPKVSISSFVVGPGVLEKIRELGDEPASDELYFPPGEAAQWSVTKGMSGRRYEYTFATNRVDVFSPTSSAA